MPDERLRAIRWGGELLAQIATDDSLAGQAMDAAKRIALTYPTPQLLEACLQSGATGLPPEWTAALFDALAFFDEIGGLSESLPVNFNDVDLSYKVRDAGLRIVWVAGCELYHFESRTRARTIESWEHVDTVARWGRPGRDDYLPVL